MTSAPTTSSVPRDEPLAAVRRQSGARAVYELLRSRIIDGSLAADTRLTEPVLAAQLGVSRTPVREALRLLQAEALVVEQPTGGVRVAPLAVNDLHRVYDVRARLEGLLARDACERAQPADVARLSRLVDLMDTVRDHEDEVLRIGAQFHGEIATLADNRWCSELLRQIRGHVDRYRSLSARERVGTTDHVDEHRAVASAIASGDPDAAERAMREHIERSGAMAAKALGEAPPPG
ncbi:GntR family transcriptional regulator [Oerskovia turbata]|uniref:GntR family transcriptional regulator n=1 Tax=Oerskovia turbata TaxID=1713 RepID=A0A4Q1L0W8_9CELL|nr:GntR family transcriptional regulator [Oerskovia turbata]RXR27046.1 GntR family transcriptional regulator [Oerskovia turbata]RXR36386.1 GntR family transcriptional regulator [Oerskovia turbata]TGJ95453.1 GntR family transcriptional regulator [Actinotalea fermentans ATCC 43279 = JCM 9966 = DSM 3133]